MIKTICVDNEWCHYAKINHCRYFSLDIWVVYQQLELDWCIFDQNWATTRTLHFQIFQILNATDRPIVHCSVKKLLSEWMIMNVILLNMQDHDQGDQRQTNLRWANREQSGRFSSGFLVLEPRTFELPRCRLGRPWHNRWCYSQATLKDEDKHYGLNLLYRIPWGIVPIKFYFFLFFFCSCLVLCWWVSDVMMTCTMQGHQFNNHVR